MENIFIFIGSKKDFNDFLSERNVDDTALKFMDLIRQYNELIRASNVGFLDTDSLFTTGNKSNVEDCVVRGEDYASVLEHVVTNFTQIISLGHNIRNLYLHNPPKRIIETLESEYKSSITYRNSEYRKISKENLKEISSHLEDFVVGQKAAKRKVLSNLYRLSNMQEQRPIIMLFAGPSGVGKTELAKSLSDYLDGKLLRIQFSMMQTNEASNYIFGDKHSKSSFARDLLQRESNIVLIDEFDKVHPNFYNAFYEIFDEGIFNDLNYSVDVNDCIFILTSNFNNETEIVKNLGMPIYSRISSIVKFDELNDDEKILIITKTYENVISSLDLEDAKTVEILNVKEWFAAHASDYNNIRLLNSRIQEAVYDILTSQLLDN
ncbi:AAA family ATPase [Niallia taxi]|uniref:AAA family ATPase n=1 Tax=Niallia taxi TaxID=2499688 RepID=UPI002E2219DC|nr:AAA family ATPase [Niallia taxi]MED4057571.1 AAA family ATPase [Niallia taxi]